jgi:hypothetical protein
LHILSKAACLGTKNPASNATVVVVDAFRGPITASSLKVDLPDAAEGLLSFLSNVWNALMAWLLSLQPIAQQ